jgi:glycosyltransferase involved in cell wall biosynthesis
MQLQSAFLHASFDSGKMQFVNKLPRIGIDLHVVDGIYQGSRTHVLELFSRVVSRCPEFEFFLFADGIDAIRKFSPRFQLPNVHFVRMPESNPVKRLGWQLPRLQKEHRLDLLHCQYIAPPVLSCRSLVTIHDILFESHPQYFSRLFTLRSRLLVRLSASRAAHIFTVSNFSRGQIEKLYKIHSDSITVIPNGVDMDRFHPGEDGAELTEHLGLQSKNYILTVGRLEPRKNHIGLLKSYALLHNPKPPLVVVGQKHFGFDEMLRYVTESGIEKSVRFLEHVDDEALPALYRHARLFVYPTWAEGFGMPVLEAMASGVPVISSDNTSLPEVVGEAGVLVKAGDIQALASHMQQLLDNPALAERLSRNAQEQAKLFTWERAADRVGDVYRQVLTQSKRQEKQ